MPEYVLGTVHDTQWPDDLAETFRSNTTAARAGCSSCWARGLCGGGCPYRGVLARGLIADRDRLQCELDRHIASLAIRIYIRVVERDPSVWVRMFPDRDPGPAAIRSHEGSASMTGSGCSDP
jgi:sulfatase maturation enzyme AslB (radical SAM superfamily)